MHASAVLRTAHSRRDYSAVKVLPPRLGARALSPTPRAGAARRRRGQCRIDQRRNAAQAGGSATSRSCSATDKTLARRRTRLGTRVGTLTYRLDQKKTTMRQVSGTDLARERDAVAAMTVLDRFEIAVVTSISAWDSGGMRRWSPPIQGRVESHGGIYG